MAVIRSTSLWSNRRFAEPLRASARRSNFSNDRKVSTPDCWRTSKAGVGVNSCRQTQTRRVRPSATVNHAWHGIRGHTVALSEVCLCKKLNIQSV